MPKSCAVIGCNSSARMVGRKFFRFPMLNKSSARSLAITQTRQESWNIALNRAEFFPSHYKNATVCDLHFISGKSAKYTDVTNADWVPSLNLGYKIKIEPQEPVDSYEHFEVNEHVKSSQPDVRRESKQQPAQTNFPISVHTQTDDKFTGMSTDIIDSYKEKIAFLEEMLCSNNDQLENFTDRFYHRRL